MTAIREQLRAATAASHDRVEAAFAPFDIMTFDGYLGFLSAQAASLLPLEAQLGPFVTRELGDWPARQRGPDLIADLADLGRQAVPAEIPSLGSDAARFGALYVLEGSRMGARLMAARLAKADHRGAAANRFLTHGVHAKFFTGFVPILNARVAGAEAAAAIAGAELTFDLFIQSAGRFAPLSDRAARMQA